MLFPGLAARRWSGLGSGGGKTLGLIRYFPDGAAVTVHVPPANLPTTIHTTKSSDNVLIGALDLLPHENWFPILALLGRRGVCRSSSRF